MFARIFAFVALFVSLFAVAGTAQAAPASTQSSGRTALVLTVQASEVEDNAFKATVLTCGRGDSHPRSSAACAALAASRVDLNAMQADDRPCPYIYAPVEVSVFGIWRGEPVAQVRTFPNSCVMLAHTGAIFEF